MGLVADGVKALAHPGKKNFEPLYAPQTKAGIAAGKGSSKTTARAGSGIASPLTEKTKTVTHPTTGNPVTVPDRTYHPVQQVPSVDNLFVWEDYPIASAKFLDAASAEVEIRWAPPDLSIYPPL